MPLETPRIISGWAAFSASAATSLAPAVNADSTFFTKVRMRLTRDLLTSARRSFRRMRFLAWGVFAIGETLELSVPVRRSDGRDRVAARRLPRVRKARSLLRCGLWVNAVFCAPHRKPPVADGGRRPATCGYRWHLPHQ